MYITRIQVNNYKSYYQSPVLYLAHGFNILTGQNNTGKTALLEALQLSFKNASHRSLKTVPRVAAPVEPQSFVDITLVVSHDEISNVFLIPGTCFQLPVPVPGTPIAIEAGYTDETTDSYNRLACWFFAQQTHTFAMRWVPDMAQVPGPPSFIDCPIKGAPYAPICARYNVQPDHTYTFDATLNDHNAGFDPGLKIIENLKERIYCFDAQRFNLGVCDVGNNAHLAPNARNLAEVLANLQSHHFRYRRYTDAVQRVLPMVRDVSVRNIGDNRGFVARIAAKRASVE